MTLPRPTSIRQHLLLISVAITLLTLSVAGTVFVVNDLHMLRGQMVRDLEVLSVVVGDNCLSSLVFDAPETAEKNLASLRREYQIRFAVLYDGVGKPFAHYRRDPGQTLRDPIGLGEGVFLDTSLFGLGTVDVVRGISLDGQPIGQIFIHARMDELAKQLQRYAGMVGLLFLVTLTVSLLFALRLHRRVSDPILHLAARTREISEGGNYALRVSHPHADDEIASLFRGFNAMLEQIERREQDLTHIGAHLEHLVDERTRALNGVVRELRLILEALPLGVIHLIDRRVVRVNPRAIELFGWPEEELLGVSTERFYPNHEVFEEVGREAYTRMAGGGVYRDDRILKRKDGSAFWGRLIGQYVDPRHPELGSIWIVDDIDRDKALEERLQQARAVAEAASRAKDMFLANMSHELRTPLNSVLGFAQLLDDDGRLDEAQRQHLRSILRGGQRLLGLINEVLDLAKIEAGRVELVPVEWDSGELLQELQGMFSARGAQKGIEVHIVSATGLPRTLSCDAKCVHQVLVNLLDNAIKYTERGSVTLRAGFEEGCLTLEVSDTGVGIPADRLEEIFEPFRQAGDVVQKGQGAGLGLAITKRLVERMGGAISVDSRLGEGSTFRVRLPAQIVAASVRHEPGASTLRRAVGYRRRDGEGPLRILIADDESENRLILRSLLEPLGFAVEEVEDGRLCVERAKAQPPDLILMDLSMPKMCGLDATRALREHPATRKTPIVAVTAAAFAEDRAGAMAAGCDAHLAKPLNVEVLLETLETLLPLTWVHNEPVEETDVSIGPVDLPSEQVHRLAKLVQTGSISAIKALAEELAGDGCCPELTRRIAALADEFDVAGLRQLVRGLSDARSGD